MVDPYCDAVAPGGRHEFGRLLDRLGRAPVVGLPFAGRSPGRVDGGAGRAELDGDAAPGAAGRAGDEGDLSGQRHGILR